jgi:hypothetical protein
LKWIFGEIGIRYSQLGLLEMIFIRGKRKEIDGKSVFIPSTVERVI